MPVLPSHESKVAIMPCTGIGQVLGTITRQAAYKVCEELRPDQTLLLCLPALVRGVREDIDMIENNKVLLIEGCKDRCAAAALAVQNGSAAVTINLPAVLKEAGVKVKDTNRSQLTKDEETVVDILAQRVAEKVDELIQLK
ncbi:hypothetical protein KAR48_06385 [bacterium]|nr:hypothetical protein [bacterium]